MLNSKKTEIRRKNQLAFLESKNNIIIGSESSLPLPLNELEKIDVKSPYVQKHFNSGLTAEVFKLSINGELWTLKKKRNEILVKNTDGLTSFLNEIQRRQEFNKLKKSYPNEYEGIVETIYANLNSGIILSRWIDGKEVGYYNEKILDNIFKALIYMEIGGIFENDPTTGNIIVNQEGGIKFFDFGYAYRFDPLKDFNPEGKETPIFHAAERFETRAFMLHLLDIENVHGIDKVLDIFLLEKKAAIKYYELKLNWLKNNKADIEVIEYFDEKVKLWKKSIGGRDTLIKLYQLDSFRSFLMDVHDDLSGKSCTPDTILKASISLQAVQDNFDFLKENNAFFWGDEKLTKDELIEKFSSYTKKAKEYQLQHLDGFNSWKENRIKNIKQYY